MRQIIRLAAMYLLMGTPSHAATVSGDFEGSNIYNVVQESLNVFACQMKPDSIGSTNPDHNYYWFYLKITGAAGQAITIKLTNCEWMPDHWNNYKPVYSYSSDPNNLTNHNWQRIANTSRTGTTVSFTQTYTQDTAWVALRYPYMYTYLTRYVDSLRANPFVSVESAGVSEEGRIIHWIKITDPAAPMPKKGILVLAREHASEQDGSWTCEGMMKFLLSNDPMAAACRQNAVFAFMPIIDPDAAFHGRTRHINAGSGNAYLCSDFMMALLYSYPFRFTETQQIWNNKVNAWLGAGNTWNMCLYLHNPHGSEQNVWLWNKNTSEKNTVTGRIDNYLTSYTIREDTGQTFYLGAVLERNYSTISLGYEINMHAAGKYLDLGDYDSIGTAFVKGIGDYYNFSTTGNITNHAKSSFHMQNVIPRTTAEGKLVFGVDIASGTNFDLGVFDITGRKIWHYFYTGQKDGRIFVPPTVKFANGIYFTVLRTGEKLTIQKFSFIQ